MLLDLFRFDRNGWNISYWDIIWNGNTTCSTSGLILANYSQFRPVLLVSKRRKKKKNPKLTNSGENSQILRSGKICGKLALF